MRRFVVLALLLGLMTLLQALQAVTDAPFHPLSLGTFGFVLLAAYTLGEVAANLRLPKITGYIVTGLVFGPQVLNIFSSAVEADLRVVNELAIGLIALSAGAEMHLAGLKRIARSLLWIVVIKGLLILAAVMAAVVALASFMPFLSGQPIGLVLSVGMILGVLAIGTSPAATIAVINETRAKGRLADTTLGVAVAKDIVMVVLLALAIALARTFSPDSHGFEIGILGELALHLFLSLLAGGILGGLIIGYMRYVGAELWLFVVGIIFAMTAIAHQFHLEALLVFIVAGFVVQNISDLGDDFVHLVEKLALPIYVVFFSVAGAGLDLSALQMVLLVVLALVTVRIVAIFVGTAVATRIAGEPEPIRRNAWLSFVSQAGVVIGLSIIVENNLPGLGTEIRTLVMGTVAINLLVGPVLFKLALSRTGEAKGSEVSGEALGAVEGDVDVMDVGTLPRELAEVSAALEDAVTEALGDLARVVQSGPLQIADDARRGQAPAAAHTNADVAWSRDMTAAVDRFWGAVHEAALAVPVQLTVPLEARWFDSAENDTAAERWMKRLRRFRRALRRMSGTDPRLRRRVLARDLALYHIDNALAEDLEPALIRLAAQPAFAAREVLRARRPSENGSAAGDGSADVETFRGEAIDVMVPVVEARFETLRRELAEIGTIALSSRGRRPSQLHENAERIRSRIGETIVEWDELAKAVVEHDLRRDAVDALRRDLKADTDSFETEFRVRFDEMIVQPLQRARHVVEEALKGIGSMNGTDNTAIERSLLDFSESLSLGLRREALAGLRRSLETRPLVALVNRFDDQVEERLEELPEAFRVVDPDDLPDPLSPPRSYPETASHELRLIATGAVERTLRPTLARLKERSAEAAAEAARSVQEIRENLELRFDAALDAAMDESRSATEAGAEETESRKSLQIAANALDNAAAALDAAHAAVEAVEKEAIQAVHGDLEAMIDRLGTQLASARPLEARLQAERARVELRGTAVLRLVAGRIRRRVRNFLVRIGLRHPAHKQADGAPSGGLVRLSPGGREGSDRAVLFHILFDETTLAGKIFDACLILTILASILVLMLESVEPIRLQHGTTLAVLEWLFTLLFTLEYAARLWAVDRPARYALSFFGIIDFLAVIPSYLSLLIPGGQFVMVIRILRVARAFRVLKLARFVGEAQVLVEAMKASRYKITVFLVYVVSVAVIVGSAMYLIEGPGAGFTSIPRGVYWAIVTLTTVGFGDITPLSPLGQTLAAILMILGYGIIAVPTGIVTAEIASRPTRRPSAQTCAKCGHEEENPAAAYCLVCGASLDPR